MSSEDNVIGSSADVEPSKSSFSGGRIPGAEDSNELDGVERFIEQMGMSAQSDGGARIAGRISGYFIVHGGPVSFAQLATELKISRGSVSTNARILVAIGFIERVTKPGDRQDYYQLASSPFLRMIEGYMVRMRRMQDILVQASSNIPEDMTTTHKRLAQMSHFFEAAVRSNDQLLQDLGQSESHG